MQEDLEPQDNNRKNSFLINLLSSIENFNLSMFKQKKEEKKEQKEEDKQNQKKLKDSSVTIDAIAKERGSYIKRIVLKLLLIGFIIILITGAVILSLQDNESMERKNYEVKEIILLLYRSYFFVNSVEIILQ